MNVIRMVLILSLILVNSFLDNTFKNRIAHERVIEESRQERP